MAFGTGLSITGIREAVSRIDGVGNRAKNPLPRKVSAAILHELQANEARRFRTGRGWRRLTPRWVQYKRAHGFDTRKLVMTGGLERTLTRGGADVKFVASRYQIVFGLKPSRRYNAIARVRRPVMADRPSRQASALIVQRHIAGGR